MGVSGCGKTTAALNLHNALGWPVAEADDFHPEANIDKMSRGIALTDEDRWPWLESMRDWMSDRAADGVRTIVTCSALKRSYRDLLSGARGRVFFIHLLAQPEELQERMAHREGHFMPPSLLRPSSPPSSPCPMTRTASPWSRGDAGGDLRGDPGRARARLGRRRLTVGSRGGLCIRNATR